MKKRVKVFISVIIIIVSVVFLGYLFRFDRFGLSQISWVDCLQINDVKYYSDFDRFPVNQDNINKKIGVVKFNVSKTVHNPNYQFRNGDATYLDIGTEIYSIKTDSNSIAVKVDDKYFLYQSKERNK